MNAALGQSLERQLELLKKQRDEAFEAREVAVDSLRQRVVREGQTIMAMRAGFADAAEQLRLALAQIPLTDESLECLEDRGVAGMAADAGVDAADADDAPATEGDVWDALFADEPAMVMDDDDVA